jgi:hypothetical protein
VRHAELSEVKVATIKNLSVSSPCEVSISIQVVSEPRNIMALVVSWGLCSLNVIIVNTFQFSSSSQQRHARTHRPSSPLFPAPPGWRS